MECPICFDVIESRNTITTECGHQFHASCIMKNISRNGFSCPCCRFAMAEKEDDDTDTIVDEIDSDEEEEEEEEEIYSDDALRGLRFFLNRQEGEENDQEDVVIEFQQQEEIPTTPSLSFITRKLIESGITMNDAVAACMSIHEEYAEDVDIDFAGDQLWAHIRRIISNYVPEPHVHPELHVDPEPEENLEPEENPEPEENLMDEPLLDEDCGSPIPHEADEIDIHFISFDEIFELQTQFRNLEVDFTSQPKICT